MEYRKIGELTKVVTGGTPSTSVSVYWENGTIPWLQSGCCQNCDVNSAEKYITQEGYDNSSTQIMPKDTVMIALTGATAGKVGYLNFEACGNQSITGILPCNNLNQRFLYYYLISKRQKVLADCIGGAQPHISQGYVKDFLVPLYSLEKQKDIVNVLTRLSNVINLNKKQIRYSDELIKARFVELFENRYPTIKVGDCIKTTSGGTPSKNHPEYYKDGNIPWLTSGEVNAGIIESPKNFITESGMNNSSAKFIPTNSVVVAMYGATAGVTGITKYETTTNQAVCSLLPTEKFIPEYLYHAVSMKKEWMISQCKGGGQPNISQGIIKNMEIINAPIEAQNEFSAFVKQLDKSKFVCQKKIELYQELLDKKMDEYFNPKEGEA